MSPTLRLWQLISPTLPVGAFSFSQGLEQAVESGAVADAPATLDWVTGVLEHGLAYADLPILKRVHAAARAGDAAAVERGAAALTALRETSELRLEDASIGGALTSLLQALDTPMPAAALPYPCAFAVACAAWRIDADTACTAFAWTWCEAQIAAAVKLVPLGHTAGQRLLLALSEPIERAVAAASVCSDADLGGSLPGFALASMLHETQYTRLFRS